MTLVLYRCEWLNARNLRLTPGEGASVIHWLSDFVGPSACSYHDYWIPVTTAWRFLHLRLEKRPPIRRVAANKFNKQSRAADNGWSSSLEVGRGANNSSPSKLVLLRNRYICLVFGLILLCNRLNGKGSWVLVKDGSSESGMGSMEWTDLAQDKDRWLALVKAVMNFRVP